MLFTILIICICKSLASHETSTKEGKHNDLLPNVEKRDFLDKVARRILAQVKTKGVPHKSSVEIPDHQLDKHTEFVNKILEEESKHLRLGIERSEMGDGKKENVLQDALRSIFSYKSDSRINDEKHNIDLTLRQSEVRRKRDTNTDTEIEEGITKIPVKTVNEDEIIHTVTKNTNPSFHKRNGNSKTDTDIQVKGIKKLIRTKSNNATQTPVIVVHSNEEKNNFKKEEITSMLMSEKTVDLTTIPNYDEDNRSNDNYGNIDNNSTDDSVINTTVSNLEIGTITTVKKDVNSLKENTTHSLINNYHVVNDSNMIKSEDRLTTKNLQYTDYRRNIRDSTNHPLNELTSGIVLNDFNASKGYKDKRITSTTKLKPTTKFILKSINSVTAPVKEQLKSVNKEKIIKNNTFTLKIKGKNQNNGSKDNINIASNSTLRQKVDIDNIENKKMRTVSYDIKSSSEHRANTYQVYEIGPGQVPFVKVKNEGKKQRIKDRYSDVPVYKYSPNNAYYYPYNNFRPNFESDKPSKKGLLMANISSNEKTTFDNYLNGNYYFNEASKTDRKYSDEHDYVENIEKLTKTPQKFVSLSDRPMLNDNLKDYLRSLRKVLKKQKYDKILLSDKDRKANFGRGKIDDVNVLQLTQLLNKRLEHNSGSDSLNGISADYYFGRDNSKNQIMRDTDKIMQYIKKAYSVKFENKKHLGRLPKLKHNKDDYMNILTVTPHPIKNEDDIVVNAVLPILLTDRLNNNILYSGNIREIADDSFVLEDLDNLKGPPKADDEIAAFEIEMQFFLDDNSEALQQYDWLATTVNIQSAIDKLQYMIDDLVNGRDLHPADLELLKYTIFLHIVAKHEIEKNYVTNRGQVIRERTKKTSRSPLPRNKRKPKRNYVKTKGLIDRIWLYRANINNIGKHDLFDFQQFLNDLQNSLYDLHNAMKYISMITSYKNQRWFRDLEVLYLNNAKTKQYLDIILHLSTVRLIDLIEDSSKNGLEDNFMVYVKKNREIVRRSIEEFVFVKRVLEEIKKL